MVKTEAGHRRYLTEIRINRVVGQNVATACSHVRVLADGFVIISDHHTIVGAGYRDRHWLIVKRTIRVRCAHRVAQHKSLSGRQKIEGIVGARVESPGNAVRITLQGRAWLTTRNRKHGKQGGGRRQGTGIGTAGVEQNSGNFRSKDGVRRINVADTQGSRCAQYDIRFCQRRHRTVAGTNRDIGRIVTAGHSDGQGACADRPLSIGNRVSEGVGHLLTKRQCLNAWFRIVQLVGIAPVSGDGQRAIGSGHTGSNTTGSRSRRTGGDPANRKRIAKISVGVVRQNIAADNRRGDVAVVVTSLVGRILGDRCNVDKSYRRIVGAGNGDGDGLVNVGAKVVGNAGSVGLGDALAFLERLRGWQAVVEGVGPLPCRGIEQHAAVGGARGALQGPGPGCVGVNVAGAQGAAGADDASHDAAVIVAAGFGHAADQLGGGVGDHRRVVGAVEGDGDRLIHIRTEVVGDAGSVGLGDALVFFERLRGWQAVVEGVGPLPCRGIEQHAAVGGARGALQGPGPGCVGVNVAGAQGAAGADDASHDAAVIVAAGFGHAADQLGGGVGDHRRVVGAVEGDGDRLIHIRTEVVGDAGSVGLGDALAFLERLCGWQTVVEGVGPLPGAGVEREAAIGGALCTLQAPGLGGAGIDIGSAQGAANGGKTGHDCAVIVVAGFGDAASQLGGGVGDHRCVVGAGNGDGEGSRADITICIGNGIGEGISACLSLL